MARWLCLLIGLVCLSGCRSHAPTILGAAPGEGRVVSVRDLRPASSAVMIQGRMTEKCPVAGCWFLLQDKTGTIKVDTKNAGFAVTDVPIGTDVTVAGRLKTAGERRFAADGLRY